MQSHSRGNARRTLLSIAAALTVIVILPISLNAQRRVLTEEQRNERDLSEREFSLRTLGKFKKKDLEVGPRPINLQQVKKDFEGMQLANNNILRALATRQPLNHEQIKTDVSTIRRRASNLKAQLSLPKPDEAKPRGDDHETLDEPLRTSLLKLDTFIANFVNNPIFKSKPIVVDAKHSVQASRDLDHIIDLSGKIKKSTIEMHRSSLRTP